MNNYLIKHRTRILSGFTAATVAICTLPFFIEPEHLEASEVLSSNAVVSEADTRDAGYSWERSFRNEVLAQCEKMDGVVYEWGGSGSNGIDCAGSVSLAYSAALGTVWIGDREGDYGEMTLIYYGGGAPDEYGFYWPGYAGIKSTFIDELLDDRGIYPEENSFSDFETNGESGIQSDEWIDIIQTYGIKPADIILWWNDDNDDVNPQHITIYAGIENGIPMHWTASSTAGYFCKKPLADSSSELGKGSFTGFMGLKATGLYEEPYVGFCLDKTDPSGFGYLGCVFSFYSDSSLGNKIGELTDDDGDGIYTDYYDLSGRSGYDDKYLLTRVSGNVPSYEDTIYVVETTGPSAVILPDGTEMSLKDSSGNVPDIYDFADDNRYTLDISLTDTDGTYGTLEYLIKDADRNDLYYDYVSSYSYLQGSDVIVISNNDTGEFSDASSLYLEKVTSSDLDVTTTVFTVSEGSKTVAAYKYSDGSWNWYDAYNRKWDTDVFPIKYDKTYTVTETFDDADPFMCIDGSTIGYKVINDTDGWTKVNDTTYTYQFTTGSAPYLNTYSFTVENNISFGKIKVEKNVSDEDDTRDGFVFELWNEAKTKMLAKGTSSDDGIVYWETGNARHQAFIEVPSGKYVLAEIEPSRSYNCSGDEYVYMVPEGFTDGGDGKWYKAVTIGDELHIENVTNDRTEGSIRLVKTSEDNVVEGVEFELYYGGKADEPVWEDKQLAKGSADKDGVVEFTDLPVGWYRIDEVVMPAYSVHWDDGSDGKSRIVHITGADDNKVIGVSVNNVVDIHPSVHTELTDKNGSHNVACGTSVDLTDKVYFEDLVAGYEYTVTGSLADRRSGDLLVDEDGSEYIVSIDFIADDTVGEITVDSQGRKVVSGYIEVPFTVDTVYLYEQAFNGGSNEFSIVCFETVSFRGVTVASHKDLEDDYQTVTVAPKIRTSATDRGTGTGVLTFSEVVDIDDKVSFENLAPGETYVVTGTLMDKKTGKPYTDPDGKTYTSEMTFAGSSVGFVMVHFEDVKLPLTDVDIVVFERVRHAKGSSDIAVHEDINDIDQTLTRPGCVTYAATSEGNKVFMVNQEITVVDHVYYEKLEIGHAYYTRATLYLEDGSEVICNGSQVVSLQEFTPDKDSGVVDVTINFDSYGLKDGDRVVVFENIYDKATGEEIKQGIQNEDIHVFAHENLNDMDQSLTVTSIPDTGDDGPDVFTTGLAAAFIILGAAMITVVIEIRRRRVKKG